MRPVSAATACSALPAGSLTDAVLRSSSRARHATVAPSTPRRKTPLPRERPASFSTRTRPEPRPSPTGTAAKCAFGTLRRCDLFGPGVIIWLSDGQNLKAYIDAHPGTTVTIDTAGAEEALPNASAVNTLASYSSEGPAIDGSIKPDLVATGGFDGYQSFVPISPVTFATNGHLYRGSKLRSQRSNFHDQRIRSGQRHQLFRSAGSGRGGPGAAGASHLDGGANQVGPGELCRAEA